MSTRSKSGSPGSPGPAGRATARAVNGARLVALPGVGHDLPAALWPTVAREVRETATRSAQR
ncbi:hypothetical protein [Kitasatospora sp. GP82]|uniref:hypothetical protein n=1 Tax=Kitasatospora sp. GP82 TaxID=3035089 RepID=UPI00247614F8|nr:hypothetical protein [Kitasatospora sp. GP82]MDH6129585.1 hypothetical protein [Kitasatospora sp. GP82]